MDTFLPAVDPSGLPAIYVDEHGRRASTIAELVEVPGGPMTSTTPALTPMSGGSAPVARSAATTAQAPDPQGWAEMLAIGAPLAGRTVFAGIARVAPGASPPAPTPGGLPPDDWPWFGLGRQVGGRDVEGRDGSAVPSPVEAVLDALLDALRAEITRRLEVGPVDALLSGGWDSRVLTTLLAQVSDRPVTAWTTSSDIGHRLDDLVAAEVAEHLGIEHRLIEPGPGSFLADLRTYARAVEHQTSFHVWLVPLAERLWDDPHRCVLDGLGGGIFLDGAFGAAPVTGRRERGGSVDPSSQVERLVRYADGVRRVVRPDLVEGLIARAEMAVRRVADHVDARTGGSAGARTVGSGAPIGGTGEALTAYLVRTWPGISMGPHGLVASGCRVSTPFLAPEVVAAAAMLPPQVRAGGQVYRRLLERLDPVLAELPTAAMLASRRRPGRRRTHPRRVSSEVSAGQVRDAVCSGPVASLLAPEVRSGEVAVWQRLLDRTGPQHVLRSLAVLDDWVRRWSDVVGGDPIEELVEAWSGGRHDG